MSHWSLLSIQKKAQQTCSPKDETKGTPQEEVLFTKPTFINPVSTREQGDTDVGGTEDPTLSCQVRPMPEDNHKRTRGPLAHHLHHPMPKHTNGSAVGDPSPPTSLGGIASAGSSSHITQSIYDFFPFEIWAFTTHRKEEESASKPVNL